MTDRTVTIYFMSGTGNSYRVASWMGDYCMKQANVSSAVIPIERANPSVEIEDSPDSLLGIVMPTHAFTAPWHVIKHVLRLPRRKMTRAFCVATRAGLKFGAVFPPGLSGSGTFLISLILTLKGYRVAGVASIDMPCNWIAAHPGLASASVAAIIARANPKALGFIEKIFFGKSSWLSLNNLYEFVFGTALFPVSLMYLVAGRFYLAKLFFASNDCTGCGLCAENCPAGAIRMFGVKKKTPYWRFRCESCMRCMAYCPGRAVEAGHSWAIILYFITTIPVSVYLFSWLGAEFPALSVFDNKVTRHLIYLIYLYVSLFVAYIVFSLLIRIPIMNNFFAWTTLTRFYRRYNEPGTRVADMS